MRSNDLRVICQHTHNLRPCSTITKRFTSENKCPREPYVLPRLVIDLDAADSQYVRPINELPPFYPKDSRKPNPVQSKPEQTSWRPQHRYPALLNPNLTTPPDLLTFALMGDPQGPWNRITQNLRHIFRYRKIPIHVSLEQKFQQLSADFEYDASKGPEFQRARHKAYVYFLTTCAERGGFPELSRIVSRLCSTEEGCLFLASAGTHLREAIRLCRKEQRQYKPHTLVTSSMILLLYNNMRINMESRGIGFDTAHCHAALYYAAKDWSLTSLRTCLKLMDKDDRRNNSRFRTLQAAFTPPMEAIILHLIYEPERAAGPLGTETLKLITGWDETNPDAECRRGISLVSRLRNPVDGLWGNLCTSYLAGMAELKLVDTISREWNARIETAVDKYVLKRISKLRAQVFALTFQLAGDRDQAVSTLSAAQEVENDDDLPGDHQTSMRTMTWQNTERLDLRKTRSEPLAEDSSLKESSPEESAPEQSQTTPSRRVRLLQSFFQKHYNYHNVQPSKVLWDLIETQLSHAPEDPEEFLDMAENFFIRDYRVPITTETRWPKELQWVDLDGVQGLVLYGEEEGVPVYWKQASRAVVSDVKITEP